MERETVVRQLVVNADDFGLHHDINRAIEQAHQNGIVTSTSLVACGTAFEQATQIIRRCTDLDVGIHLTLVGERPLSRPALVTSLINCDGVFWPNYLIFARRLLSGQISTPQVKRELETQIQRVYQAGLQPSHLDSHQHVHVLPGVWPIVIDLAKKYSIHWIRVPSFSTLTKQTRSRTVPIFRQGMNLLSWFRRRQLAGLHSAKNTPGLHLSGRLNKHELVALLLSLPKGISEIVTHPGHTTMNLQQRYHWNYQWTEEYEALIDPKTHQTVAEMGIDLVNFRVFP